jgi:hypothetical protein
MAPPLRAHTAEQLLRIVGKLKGEASFRNILREASSQGVLAWNMTLRRYLDLLVQAQVLKVSEHDVGSVHPRQLYTKSSTKPVLWTGLTALKLHGLNWDIPDTQLTRTETDLEAVARAKIHALNGKPKLVASLEDALVHEVESDATRQTGAIELAAAILATRTVDLPYMLRRADSQNLGQTVRRLFKKITETFTSLPGDVDGRAFLETRTCFLKILRGYNSRGHVKLVEARGRGQLGLDIVEGLRPEQIVSVAAKQLGVSG